MSTERACHYCHEKVDPALRSTWQRVVGWQITGRTRPGGGHGGSDIAARQTIDEYACDRCVSAVKARINPGQVGLL